MEEDIQYRRVSGRRYTLQESEWKKIYTTGVSGRRYTLQERVSGTHEGLVLRQLGGVEDGLHSVTLDHQTSVRCQAQCARLYLAVP